MRTRAALVVLALLAGCGGSDENEPDPASTPVASATATVVTTATPTPGVSATPAGDPLPGAGTGPAVEPAENTEVALLTDVRAARHEGYDRVVFEFRNAVPGHDVRYVDEAVADGSGEKVELNGDAILQIRMENALDADLSDPGAPETYTGPERLRPDATVVAEVARTGGFEGVLTWAAGLRVRAPFRVSTLEQPPRLVVDVRTG